MSASSQPRHSSAAAAASNGRSTIVVGGIAASFDPNERHPRVDPLAAALFRQLRDQPTVDRQLVFSALVARLSEGPNSNPERVTLALRALALCAADTTNPTPSRSVYDRWRDSQARPEEWPSSTGIRNAFAGSWAKALDATGARPAPDVLARRLMETNYAYTREEILAALKAYVAAVDPARVTYRRYREWATEELRNPARTLKRLPLSATVIKKHFGYWGKAVAEAGFADRLQLSSQSGSAVRGPRSAYGEAEFIDALRRAAASCKTETPTIPLYEAWRRAELAAARAGGEGAAFIPATQSIARYFGGWAKALLAAGLITEEAARLARSRGPRRRSDEEMLADVRQALADHGPDFLSGEKQLTRTEYRRLRLQRMRERGERPVSDMGLTERFGSWLTALARATGDQDPSLAMGSTKAVAATPAPKSRAEASNG